ncbi:bone morphogenetic protein 7-like [Oculina patagonica]
MLFLFLSLLASQLFLVTPSVIREEQVENKEEPRSSEVDRTESESTDRDTPPFLRPIKPEIIKERKCHGKCPDDAQAQDRDTSPGKAALEVDACRKVDMYVDFETLGWKNWIIYPRGFNAYQCKGRCFPRNRSLLNTLIERKNGIKTNGETCCVPTKLKPVRLLFFDKHDNIVLHKYNMIVEECGCS